jgi:SPP1 family predicted phage head-tail adaptor
MDRQGKKSLATEARHRITLQQKQSTTDGEGGFDGNWTDVKTVWASISPIKAIQQFMYKSVNMDGTHLIRVRGLEVVAGWNRVKFGTRVFEILTVENIQERNFEKVLTCKERTKANNA